MTNLQMLLNSIEKVKEENLTIVESGGVENKGFIVINEKAYIVEVDENDEIVSCTCPHNYHRGAICKHMLKVSIEKNLNIKCLNTK